MVYTKQSRPDYLNGRFQKLKKSLKSEMPLHLMVLPAILFVLIFHYFPIYGVTLAFKDFSYDLGIFGSEWVGIKHFQSFFSSFYFGRIMKNTILLSLYTIVFSFPIPICFALLLNELKNLKLKKILQTVSYFPHFVSVVIVVGIMYTFLSPAHGIVNVLITKLGGEPVDFLRQAEWFRFLYVVTGIWQGFGWNSIIYIAALSAIPAELYEAATIDGANRFQKVLNITLPGIMPTAVIMLILSIGGLMNVGFDKVVLMYSPSIYDVSDIISTYVYRRSLIGGEFSFGVAVGLFNNVINFILVYSANVLSKKITDVSLW